MHVTNQAEQRGWRALGDPDHWRGPNCAVSLAIGNHWKFSHASKASLIVYPHSFFYLFQIQTNERKVTPFISWEGERILKR